MDSESSPNEQAVARLAFEAARRADAMGLVDRQEVAALDLPAVQRLVSRLDEAGVARLSAAELHNLERPTPDEVKAVLRLVIAALEQSPMPRHEWRSLARVFDPEQLASLLGISVSSLRRYQGGDRDTPDEVAARLHFLALVVGDLAGAYNDIGVRRWFQRKRSQLGGKAPGAFLAGAWDPDDAGPQKVRALAEALVSLSAT